MAGLVSVAHLANLLNSKFFVEWQVGSNPHCPVSYSQIFHVPVSLSTTAPTCAETCHLDLTQKGSDACWNVMACAGINDLRDLFTQCDCVKVRSNQYFSPLLNRFSESKKNMHKYAETFLHPSTSLNKLVANTVQHWKRTYSVDRVIGVHVRAAFHSKAKKNGSFVPDKNVFRTHFWPCLKSIIHGFPRQQRVGIFIAADTSEARMEAAQLIDLEDQLVWLPSPIREYPNDTKLSPLRTSTSVTDAALELFLLQNADVLVVERTKRFDSTFSAMAMSLADCILRTECYIVHRYNQCEKFRGVIEPDFHEVDRINCSLANENVCRVLSQG